MSRAPVGIGEGARPWAPGDLRGGREPEHLASGEAGRVVEHLAELGEAQLDEPVEALADPRLLGHQRHREAGRLAQLDAGEGVAHGGGGSTTATGTPRRARCEASGIQ